MSMKKYLALAAFAALAAGSSGYFDSPRVDNSNPYPKKASLPKWKVGENYIFAKNESDAIKYAKKRGLYHDGDVAKKVIKEL